jgi:hypothetical protein
MMFAAYERDLLERAASWAGHPDCAGLTPAELGRVAREHGIDFATALAYDRLQRSPSHGPFIAWMDAPEETGPAPCERRDTLVAVVPGVLYKEHPHTGAGGEKVLDLAERCGCRAERVPMLSFGSPRQNAHILLEWLEQRSSEEVILVSLSKGGADVKLALEGPGAEHAFRMVRAWISVSGIATGTAVANWFLERTLPLLMVRVLCWWYRLRFEVIRDLTRGDGSLLAGPWRVPSHMRVYHLVGFPLTHHLSGPRARKGHRRLQPLGPNDGGGILLADVLQWPGLIYPVWGADHYMTSPGQDAVALVQRLLESIAACGMAPR